MGGKTDSHKSLLLYVLYALDYNSGPAQVSSCATIMLKTTPTHTPPTPHPTHTPPTPFPTHTPPTPHPTHTSPTPFPTLTPPTPYPISAPVAGVTSTQPSKGCGEKGEFCTAHTDCCSNRCRMNKNKCKRQS